MTETRPPLPLPRRLIDSIDGGNALLVAGVFSIAHPIDGWDWLRPTVIAGKRYDWWVHHDGRHRLAPSLLESLQEAFA